MLSKKLLFLILSFLLVLTAQPDISIFSCILSSVLGFTFFWRAILLVATVKGRFLISLLWFAAIQMGHLSWFTADHYVGGGIYIFLIAFSLLLGAFFAGFTLLITKELSLLKILALSGLWTLFEWSRLFLLSGFSWDPLGLSLTATLPGMQLVSLVGIFGLSFWIVMTNLLLLSRRYLLLLIAALFPYLYGLLALVYHHEKLSTSDTLSTLLVQTALSPEEKGLFETKDPLDPLEQWRRILQLIHEHKGKKIDLIVLSEAVVPYGTYKPIYTFEEASSLFKEVFHEETAESGMKRVGNHWFAKRLSSYFNADVVIGLEDADIEEEINIYNAAFLFQPSTDRGKRYEKRILVPMGEYIPFSFCKKFLKKWGITDSFSRGKEAKVYSGKSKALGLSICYEETYGHIMRENKKLGAEILINLTNDAWYPKSRLPYVHYYHSRIRSVEGGLPLVRACNTGVTCAIDSLGNTIAHLPFETRKQKASAGALHLLLPTYTYPTLYTQWGDRTIVLLSLFLIILSLIRGFLLEQKAV